MSCDEYVMSKSGKDIRAVYGRALLGFAMNKRILAAGSLCFGESDVRRRVKNIMTYRKNKKWMGAVAVVVFSVGRLFVSDRCCGAAGYKRWGLKRKVLVKRQNTQSH